MINLAPDVEHQILENAALDGTGKRLKPEDYPDEGKDWTEEDLEVDLAWANGKHLTK